MDHAVLSPSASSRWLMCTPSVRLEEKFPDEESDFAREGTLAHSICEILLKNWLRNGVALLEIDEWKFFKTQEFYTEAMYEHCKDYAAYVIGYFSEGDLLSVEEKLDLTKYLQEGFGTSDSNLLKVKSGHLHIFDLKYGKGVVVSANDNKQLKIYALGVIDRLDFLGYDIKKVTLHIFQPRAVNEETVFTLTYKELITWAEKTLRPKAILAFAGEGVFVPGDHCLFCKAKPRCKALAEYELKLIEQYDFQDPFLLDDDEVIEIFERKNIFESWIEAVGKHALYEAVKGKKWPGYKLVEGKSNRVYKDELAVVKVLQRNLDFGYLSEIYKPQELLGITALQDKLGTENFNKFVGPLLRKPPGAPTLVPVSDTRRTYNKAAIDFADDWIDPEEDYSDL